MYVPLKPFAPDQILLRERDVTSCAQFARAIVVGGVFALVFIWMLPSRPAGAEPAPTAVHADLS